MFNFRRKSRAEIEAETLDARFRPDRSARLNNMFGLLANQTRYERTEIARGVNLYSARLGAKTLVVGFGGGMGRLNMALFMILEAMDDTRYDVLLLADLNKLHFERGISSYASSMPELVAKISEFAKRQGYSSIITYGTSMGGFPALRAGEIMGAARSISVGGRFAFHPARLLAHEKHLGAFDILCECRRVKCTQLYLLYADGHAEDCLHADMLAEIRPDCRRIRFPIADHNFPHQIRQKGNLAAFFSEMLDLHKEPDADKLVTMLE